MFSDDESRSIQKRGMVEIMSPLRVSLTVSNSGREYRFCRVRSEGSVICPLVREVFFSVVCYDVVASGKKAVQPSDRRVSVDSMV